MSRATFDSFRVELGRLVETFGKNLAYTEASLRQEFLNPLFRALGWDIENKAGLIPQHREAVTQRDDFLLSAPSELGQSRRNAS